MDLSPASQLIDQHLRRGGSVCPFARDAARLFVDVEAEAGPRRLQLLQAAWRFGWTFERKPAGALFLVAGQDLDYLAAKDWLEAVWVEWVIACEVVSGIRVRSMICTTLVDCIQWTSPALAASLRPECPTRRYAGIGTHPITSVGMGPQYPATHPRYLPSLALVATWMEDVARARVRYPGFHEQIVGAMIEQHGRPYDAEELWLELPGTRARP